MVIPQCSVSHETLGKAFVPAGGLAWRDQLCSVWVVVAIASPSCLTGALFAVSEFHVLQRASAATYFLLQALQLPLLRQ